MICLTHDTTDPVRLHGIRHFLEKNGLAVTDAEKASVGIVYGNAKCDFEQTIRILEADNQDVCQGLIRYKGEKIPAYEVPTRLEGGCIAEYAGKETYPCVTFSGKETIIGFDIFNICGQILSGMYERCDEPDADRRARAGTPVIDSYEQILFDSIKNACHKLGLPLVRKALWPDGKGFAVCLTHDVDEVRKTYQHLTRPVIYSLRGELGRAVRQAYYSAGDLLARRNPYWTFPKLMEVEEGLGVRSSLYFLEEKGKVSITSPKTWIHSARRYDFTDANVTELIVRLRDGGWDVGVHGSYYSYDNEKLFTCEKDRIEKVLDAKTVGTRQHHLNMCFPDTWNIHEGAGLLYDTSLGFKDIVGFRWGTCFPFTPFDSDELKAIRLLEIPLIIMDTPLFASRKDIEKVCDELTDTVAAAHGVLTLLWHHTVFDEREYPGWIGRYERIVRRCQDRDAWVTDAASLARWWDARASKDYTVEAGYDDVSVGCTDDIILEALLPASGRLINQGFTVIKEQGASVFIKLKKGEKASLKME
ncbi:polysaccharide deacetylase family protein [Candidatus Altiarchaeota archaeon]